MHYMVTFADLGRLDRIVVIKLISKHKGHKKLVQIKKNRLTELFMSQRYCEHHTQILLQCDRPIRALHPALKCWSLRCSRPAHQYHLLVWLALRDTDHLVAVGGRMEVAVAQHPFHVHRFSSGWGINHLFEISGNLIKITRLVRLRQESLWKMKNLVR